MKFSKQWLEKLTNTVFATEKLVTQLTMAGLEVDAVTPVAGDFSDVVVGEVIAVSPHPNADKLKLCTVDIGQPEKLSIICGANNVYCNMKAAVAQIGAVLPGNVKIKKAKLRGVASCGMLCSEKELGLAENSVGIMELPQDAPIGEDFRTYMELNDVAIEVALTPNRGDCASLIGIAREITAINHASYVSPKIEPITAEITDNLTVKLLAAPACPKYVGRVIKDVNLQAKTPLWMQERLRRSGIRSLNPVVDVTNYVLLELGQPMHAFNLAELTQNIVVRFAKPEEKLKLLNGDIVELTPETLVIADQDKPLALAGIMGGQESAVTATTKDIFLESAFFDSVQIAKTARFYGLQTDSSYRFARGVDYQLQIPAIERATQLLLDIVGGKAGPIVTESVNQYLPKQQVITFRLQRVARILGIQIAAKTIQDILQNLGMQVDTSNESWQVTIPSYRFDCTREIDLIEEVARIYGYENIPATTFAASLCALPIEKNKISSQRIRCLLQDRDYHEVITYSFVDAKLQKLLDPEQEPLTLVNPIADNMAVMRTNLWPGLINTLIYNVHHQQERVRIFEMGLRFRQVNGRIEQQSVIAGLVYGFAYHIQWGKSKRLIDFYDLKSDLEALFTLTHKLDDVSFVAAQHPALHPGKCAKIIVGEQIIGYMGALHPNIARKLDINKEVYLFELLAESVQKMQLPICRNIVKYPLIRRDLAFLADENITLQQITTIVREKAAKLLVDLAVFDVYQGRDIGHKKKSIALSLTLQHSSRTLKDNEVNELIECVIISLEEKLGLELRK